MSETISITIDGVTIPARKEQTILEAASERVFTSLTCARIRV